MTGKQPGEGSASCRRPDRTPAPGAAKGATDGGVAAHTLGVASDPPARRAKHPLGNAGLFSTAEDLSAFCRMMLGNGVYDGKRLLSVETVRMLGYRPDTKSPVAFGWRVDEKANPHTLSGSTMSHTGWAGNSIWIDPSSQKYVIILTNRTGDHDAAGNARIELAERILEVLK